MAIKLLDLCFTCIIDMLMIKKKILLNIINFLKTNMRFKRGSTSYGILVLVFFIITIFLFLPFFFKPPAQEPLIPSENATRNKINIVTTSNNAVQFEAGNIILRSQGFAVLDYTKESNYVLTYSLESCPNFALNQTIVIANQSISYNALRQTPYLRDDGTLGLRAKTIEQFNQAIIDEGVYKVTLQTQNDNQIVNINSKGELYFRGTQSPVTISFTSLCPEARLLVSLFEVEE